MMRKSQAANEFMMLLSMALLFMMLILYGVSQEMRSLAIRKEAYAIKDVGFFVQNELFYAAVVKDGYSREFEVPTYHNGVDYKVSINGNFLLLESVKSTQVWEFPIPKVNGNIQKGMNSINRTGGEIYLN